MEKTRQQNNANLDEDALKFQITNKDNKFSSPIKIVQKQIVCESLQLNVNQSSLEIPLNKFQDCGEARDLDNIGNQLDEAQQFRRQTRASFSAQLGIENKTVEQNKKKVRRPSNLFSPGKRNSMLQSSVAISESNHSVVLKIQEPLLNHLSNCNSFEQQKELKQINICQGLSASPVLENTLKKKIIKARRQSTEAKHSQIATESVDKIIKIDQLSKQSQSLVIENRSDLISQNKIETNTKFLRAENKLNGNPETYHIKICSNTNQVEEKQTIKKHDENLLDQKRTNCQLIFSQVASLKSENISEKHYQSQEDSDQDLKNQIENELIKQSEQNHFQEKQAIEINQNYIKQISKQRDQRDQQTKQIIQKALPKLLPRIRREFNKIEGACDYFEELERENQELLQQIKTLEEEQRQKKLQLEENTYCRRSTTLKAEQDLQEKKEKLQKQMNNLPKGYPQKYMYKFPKLDPIRCQAGITPFHPRFTNLKRQKRSLSNDGVQQKSKFESIPNCGTETKDLFSFESNSKQMKFEFLPSSPKLLFLADSNHQKYQKDQLDQYLSFCTSFMKEAPVQGGYAGIWLRGSTQFEANAFNLLNIYNYNFDLAKFHILYPLVMNNPEQRAQVIEIAKNNPKEVASLVQNSIIDLQGCKKEEVEVILTNFRKALADRVNDEQLAHHLTILQKIKITPPTDIQEKIQESLQFSKEIKRRCNVQASGFTKNSSNIPTEKKLRLSELEKQQEEISKFSYITPEMNSLEQLLHKARQWVLKVQEIQAQEIIQLKTIQQIHADGKIIPVNFEDLMSELSHWKSQAEELNRKVGDILVMKKTRNRINLPQNNSLTEKKSGKRSVAVKEASQSGDEIEDDRDKNNGALFNEFANFQSLHENSSDKDNFFKELLKEANSLKLTSENIQKLQGKCAEIDKWKFEVIQVFQNYKEEENNFKKYRETYKILLTRSQIFDIDLNLMNCLRAKYSMIEWREKVEDFVQNKILSSDVISFQDLSAFDYVQQLLKDGVQRNFLIEHLVQQGSEGFEINQLALKYFKIIDLQHFAYTGETGGDQINEDNNDTDKTDNEKIGILEPLFKNFRSLQILIKLQKEAFDYNKELKQALKKIRDVNHLKKIQQEDQVQLSSSEISEYSSSDSDEDYKKICRVCEKEISVQEELISTNDLIQLLGRGDQLKICMPLSEKFKIRVKIIQEIEQQIQNAYEKCKDNQYDFCIHSLQQFEQMVNLLLKFKELEVDSIILRKTLEALQPYRQFITISTRLIRQYCRPIGTKINQLELVQLPDSLFQSEIRSNPPSIKKQIQEQCICFVKNQNQELLSNLSLEKENDFQTLKAFVQCLYENNDSIVSKQQTFLFSFFKETSHGNYLKRILERTEEVLQTFELNKSQKRQPDFDIQQYFKLLDNIQTCGLAFEQTVLEEARREQKREKWIRRFHELQAVGMSQQVDSQSTLSNRYEIQNNEQKLVIQSNSTGSNVKIKQLEQLSKEYQTIPYLNTDEYCQQLAQKLISQQQACQGWLDSFNTIFNSNGQFDPPGGLTFVQQLLQQGENLELNLKEWKDLKTHLIEITEWQENISKLFKHPPIYDELRQLQIKEDCISLDQLEKLIKDTHDLTDNANPQLIELLTSLKNIVTIWKYKAKVILKIRPLENLSGIIERTKNIQDKMWHSNQKEDLFCICQQPENGSLMICCDFCEMWYHHSCIGLSPELKFLDKLEYKCITCAIREGKFTHTVLITQSHNQLLGSSNIQNHLISTADDLYGPYFDNISYRNNLVKEIDSLKDQISSNAKETQPISGSTEQGAVQQIHSLLLEHFSNKQRISEQELMKVYQQGMYALPVQLEELKELEFYVNRIQQFKEKAQIAIKTSSSQLQLWKCFLTINNPNANQENILNTQEYEFREDWTLINLIAESESLPVLLGEAKQIVLELLTRDWFREGFSIIFKCCETSKQNKVKLRRQIKRLLLRAEVLLAMDPKVSKKECSANYLKTETAVGINIVYLSWLLIRVLKGHFLFVESANPSNEQLIENILPMLANEVYWIFQEIESVIRKSGGSLSWLVDLSRGFQSVVQIQFVEQN